MHLGLQELYMTNTWPGGDHVPSNIPTMQGSSSIVHLQSNSSNYLHNDFNKAMHEG